MITRLWDYEYRLNLSYKHIIVLSNFSYTNTETFRVIRLEFAWLALFYEYVRESMSKVKCV